MEHIITVTGTGKLSVAPDQVIISFELNTQDKDYTNTLLLANQRAEALIKAVEQAGFVRTDLKTLSYSTDTVYSQKKLSNGEYTRVFKGYRCTQRMKLEFSLDNERIAKALSSISSAASDPNFDICFTVKDPDAVKDALLEKAAADARKKAAILCTASGAKLGSLAGIDYSWGVVRFESRSRFDMCLPSTEDAKCCTSFEPDDIDISDTVTFRWEILP